MPKSNRFLDNKRRKIWHFQLLKTIPFIVLFFSLTIYQLETLDALGNLELEYDLSNYIPDAEGNVEITQNSQYSDLLNGSKGENFDNFINFIVSLLGTSNYSELVNLTQAEIETIENNSDLINQIQIILNSTITLASQIYLAYLAGNISYDYISMFLKELWILIIEKYLPPNWYLPGQITLINNGWIRIKEIYIEGEFHLEDRKESFFFNKTPLLLSHDSMRLKIVLAEMIKSFVSLALDEIVNITIQLLEKAPHGIFKPMSNILYQFFLTIPLEVLIDFRFIVGFINFTSETQIFIPTIIKKNNPR